MMALLDYSNPESLAYYFRRKRMKYLVELVRDVICHHSLKEISICDIGGTESYWQVFPFEHFRDVCFILSMVNLEYPAYDHDVQLPGNVLVRRLTGNACDLHEIGTMEYHIAHSNSVIEHVGRGQEAERMASELRRVGEYYFIQTPNFWFPIEPHFLIPFYPVFPRPIRIWMQIKIRKEADLQTAIRMDDSVRLLTIGEMQSLFPDGEMMIERFMVFAKSILVRSRIS